MKSGFIFLILLLLNIMARAQGYQLLAVDSNSIRDYTLLHFLAKTDTIKVLSSNLLDKADSLLMKLRVGNVYDLTISGKTKSPNSNSLRFQGDRNVFLIKDKIVLKENEYFYFVDHIKRQYYIIRKCQ
jgi:hypothetical protein